jgi:hypothetical protein
MSAPDVKLHPNPADRVGDPGFSEAAAASARPAPLGNLLLVTFMASVSGGAFWAGIFFVTAGHYGFSTVRNLVLAGAMGLVYAIGARSTGALSRALRAQLSPRAVLASALGLWGLAALLPLLARQSEPLLWAAALLGAATSAMVWPLMESFLSAGRHGARMRSALGWYNVTWTPGTAVPLLLLPLFARWDVLWTIAISAVANAGAMLALLWVPARPAAHGGDAATASVGPEYRWLLVTSSWLLPLSYLMSATLSPVLPHRLAELGGQVPHSVVASTWMVARFVALALMWRLRFWHGRWGTLALAGAALTGGLALVLVAPALSGVIAGLALFGAGMGITYYAALYYLLAVGHAAVDAGGTFEALIGLGYFVGPLLGAVGQLAGGAHASSAMVVFTWAAAALVAFPALRPYLQARARRARPA